MYMRIVVLLVGRHPVGQLRRERFDRVSESYHARVVLLRGIISDVFTMGVHGLARADYGLESRL